MSGPQVGWARDPDGNRHPIQQPPQQKKSSGATSFLAGCGLVLGLGVLAVIGVFVLGATSSRPRIAATGTSGGTIAAADAPTTTEAGTVSDGKFIVGTDIAAGRYIADGSTGCYWARLKDASGGVSSILDNENGTGQQIVDITPTDGLFETRNCGVWRPFGPGSVWVPSTIGDGVWAVGVQLPAGRYRSTGGSSCYWERMKTFSGGVDSIADNENTSTPTVADIAPTDVGFKSQGCGTWSKIG